MADKVENCENCAFWREGRCHKRSPGGPYPYLDYETPMVDIWPHTAPDDFCGDFELKDAG